tara:strand:+ start:2478 stop:2624 length:147 start_codon:yes stop_codon:yes gene_type:complete
MLQTERKSYEAPALQELGAMNDITEAGRESNSDTLGGLDGTAFPGLSS